MTMTKAKKIILNNKDQLLKFIYNKDVEIQNTDTIEVSIYSNFKKNLYILGIYVIYSDRYPLIVYDVILKNELIDIARRIKTTVIL